MPPEPHRFLNRELSWLEFNQRVLDEARDASIPLLERLKFLAITASNLDEFFMVRVGGLQMVSAQGSTKTDPSGMTADEQLDAISRRIHKMTADQCKCFLADLEPALAQAGFRRLAADQLTREQLQFVEQLFAEEISAVLSPMAVSADEEFPLLGNQTLNVCVQLGPKAKEEEPRFALIPFGLYSRRFITLPMREPERPIRIHPLGRCGRAVRGEVFSRRAGGGVRAVSHLPQRRPERARRPGGGLDGQHGRNSRRPQTKRLRAVGDFGQLHLGNARVFAEHAGCAGEQRLCLAGAARICRRSCG